MKLRITAAACAFGLATSLAGAATATAASSDCGTTVTYSPWKSVTSNGSTVQGRQVTWLYYNCSSSTVRKGIDIEFQRDQKYTIRAKASKTYRWTQVAPGGGRYRGTYNW